MTNQEKACQEVAAGLMTTKEAAAFLGVSIAKLYGLMSTGKLAYVKLGRCRRVPKNALIALAAGHLISRP